MRDSGFSPSDVRSLGLGLMFGNDDAFSPGFRQLVKSVGVTHLVAASGANLRFVLAVPSWLAARHSWVLWQWLSLVVIWWYWQGAQQGGSLWRASLMWLTAWMSIWLGRPVNSWYAWLLAFGFTWIVDREWLSHSFWLSSLAIFGLSFSHLLTTSETNNRLLTHAEKRMGKWLGAWQIGSMIFLFVAGYLIWQFASIEPVGILTTILLEPFIPVYLVVSSISLVIEWIATQLSRMTIADNFNLSILESGLNWLQTCLFILIWYLLQGVLTGNAASGQAITRLTAILAIYCLFQAGRRRWRRHHHTKIWRPVVIRQIAFKGRRNV